MRALRFASKLHLNITDETNNTIKEYGCMLTNVPFEAIRLELMKVLTIDHPSQFFKLLHHYNLLHIISSEFEKCINHDGGKHHLEKIFHHLMLTGDSISKKFPLIRLAGYLHDIGKPQSFLTLGKSCEFPSHEKIGADIAKHIMLKLKFSTNETNFVSNLVGFHMRCVNKKMTPRTIRRLIKDLYEKRLTIQDWMRLKIADRRANLAKEPFTLSEIKNILKKINKAHVNVFSVKDLVLSGNDIMNIMNISPGPMVGIVQKNLLDKVLDSPELNTRENLEKEVLKWNQ